MVIYDRMEVLRGSAALLQGANSPGGAVNLVRKRPQAAPTVTLSAKAGSWDRYASQADVGGPLNEAGTVRGRAVVRQGIRPDTLFIPFHWPGAANLLRLAHAPAATSKGRKKS